MMLHLCYYAARRLPTGGLVEEPFVLDQRLLARPSYRTRQQFGDVPLQTLVGRDSNSIFHATLFQRLVHLRPGEGRVTPEGDLLPHLLLPLDLWQQEFFPTVGAVHIARPQLDRQTITLLIEQQQGVKTGGFEVPVVGALLLLLMGRVP